jgi:hypothetical protein
MIQLVHCTPRIMLMPLTIYLDRQDGLVVSFKAVMYKGLGAKTVDLVLGVAIRGLCILVLLFCGFHFSAPEKINSAAVSQTLVPP